MVLSLQQKKQLQILPLKQQQNKTLHEQHQQQEFPEHQQKQPLLGQQQQQQQFQEQQQPLLEQQQQPLPEAQHHLPEKQSLLKQTPLNEQQLLDEQPLPNKQPPNKAIRNSFGLQKANLYAFHSEQPIRNLFELFIILIRIIIFFVKCYILVLGYQQSHLFDNQLLFFQQQQQQLLQSQQKQLLLLQQQQQLLLSQQFSQLSQQLDPTVTSRSCPYCEYESKANNFINGVKIHIGHKHKCKNCKKINENCICE